MFFFLIQRPRCTILLSLPSRSLFLSPSLSSFQSLTYHFSASSLFLLSNLSCVDSNICLVTLLPLVCLFCLRLILYTLHQTSTVLQIITSIIQGLFVVQSLLHFGSAPITIYCLQQRCTIASFCSILYKQRFAVVSFWSGQSPFLSSYRSSSSSPFPPSLPPPSVDRYFTSSQRDSPSLLNNSLSLFYYLKEQTSLVVKTFPPWILCFSSVRAALAHYISVLFFFGLRVLPPLVRYVRWLKGLDNATKKEMPSYHNCSHPSFLRLLSP